MRKIKYLVMHCTATHQNTSVENIRNYWKKVLKWSNPGYHYIIDKYGKITELQDVSKIANGVKNFNSNSIHIAYIGGIDEQGKSFDNRTPSQKYSQLYLLRQLKRKFPEAKILGHRDFPNVKKDCPCFDAIEEFSNIFDYI